MDKCVKVFLNGKPHEHRGDGTVSSLLNEIGTTPQRVAVVINGKVIPRPTWRTTKLAGGDRLDVLTFAGGG